MEGNPEIRSDIGFKAVETLAELWQIDKDRIKWNRNGFEWWPGHYRQVVLVSDAIEGDGGVNYKLTVTTDFITDLDLENSMLPAILHGLQKTTSSYAIKLVPDEVRQNGDVTDESPSIALISSVFIRDDNVGWIPRFFSGMAILQANDAQVRAESFAETLNAKADTSGPMGGELLSLDEMLFVVRDIYTPAGQEPSRWLDTGEFEDVGQTYGRLERCFGDGDTRGLTLEVPFGSDTALIQLHTDQSHPQLGNGLLATLKLPVWLDDAMSMEPNWYNFMETVSANYVPLLGSWSTHQMSEEQSVVAFSSFIPNLLYQPGLALNMTLWMIGRANWAREQFYPDMVDEPLVEILQKRYEQNQA